MKVNNTVRKLLAQQKENKVQKKEQTLEEYNKKFENDDIAISPNCAKNKAILGDRALEKLNRETIPITQLGAKKLYDLYKENNITQYRKEFLKYDHRYIHKHYMDSSFMVFV